MNETIQGFKEGTLAGFDKIAEAYNIPADYYDEAKEQLAIEIDGMDKEAGFGADFATSFGGGPVGKAALGLGMGALGGLGAMAVHKIGKAFGAAVGRAGYDAAFRTAMKNSEILQNDPQKAKRMVDTVFGFAPTVACDANVLTNILVNSIHGDSIDLQTVKAITELEEKLAKIKKV